MTLKAVKRLHKKYPWQATFIAPNTTGDVKNANNKTIGSSVLSSKTISLSDAQVAEKMNAKLNGDFFCDSWSLSLIYRVDQNMFNAPSKFGLVRPNSMKFFMLT